MGMAEIVIEKEMARLTASNSVVKNPMKEEREKLFSLFSQMVNDLTQDVDHPGLTDLTKRYAEVLHYNVVGGKMIRALTFVMACTNLMEGSFNETKSKLIYSMGWCIELLQAAILVADDIMDGSETRRGKLCWYKHVGSEAINDSFLLKAAVYSLLKKYHEKQPYYTKCLAVFKMVHCNTNFGQAIDSLTTTSKSKPGLHLFTQERFALMCKYKTTYYSFVLPISLAMHVVGISEEKLHRQVVEVLTKAGIFFQSENDFLDCYGEEEVTGKAGTDIEEGKCTWLVVTALKLANEEQRKVLEECYGSNDPDDVSRVKSLYNELNLRRVYKKYAEELRSSLFADFRTLPSEKLQKLCERVIDEIYIRNTEYAKKIANEQCMQ